MNIDLLAGMASVPMPPARTLRPTVLCLDSGLGGLTVFREVRRLLADADYVYAADDAAFPVGDWPETALLDRVGRVVGILIARYRPDLVVVACNTISTLVLPGLRARFDIPFVGTVPAVKPAAAASRTGRIAVLATPGTVRRDYTRGLVDAYAGGCRVDLVGSTRLAGYAEAELAGEPVADALIRAEIAPCFVDRDGARTDAIVLACTHYPLLVERLTRLAPWPVTWVDPAPAIARRVVQVLGGPEPRESVTTGQRSGQGCRDGSGVAVFTGRSGPAAPARRILERFGLTDLELAACPLA